MASRLPSSHPQRLGEVSDCLQELLQLEAAHHFAQRHRARPDELYHSLEWMGFRIGHALMERLMKDKQLMNLTADPTDAIKLLCKEFWQQAFKKYVDNLRTNKRGTFILRDNQFRWLRHVSHRSEERWIKGQRVALTRDIDFKSGLSVTAGQRATVLKFPGDEPGTVELELPDGKRYDAKERDLTIPEGEPVRIDPLTYLTLPSGMVRGALHAVGLAASVEARMDLLPAAEFTITLRSKSDRDGSVTRETTQVSGQIPQREPTAGGAPPVQRGPSTGTI